MIHPRQSTSAHFSATLGNLAPLRSIDPLRDRAPRYCPCGTRLRRSKPFHETLCDTCDQKRVEAVAADELHPPILVDSWKVPCRCGQPKDRKARVCHTCRQRRQGEPESGDTAA